MSQGMKEYHTASDYRDNVIQMHTETEFPAVPNAACPVVNVLQYHHLGVVCADVAAAVAFYAPLGFVRTCGDVSAAKGDGIVLLVHINGLTLHLIQADVVPDSAHNVLMDDPICKAPGHTHASWSVPSIPAAKEFLASQGVELSGTRSTLAFFMRDTDRTTLEFERNDGGDQPPANGFDSSHVGGGKPLDHVGIRVRAPYERHLIHYTKLGFTSLVNHYAPNQDPLK